MSRVHLNLRSIAVSAFAISLVGCGKEEGAADSSLVDFATEVKPILEGKCVICHNSSALVGRVNFETKELAFGESERGKFILPGDPDSSLVYTLTLAPHGEQQLPAGIDTPMPSQMPALSGVEKATLKRWIKEGANWPDGAAGQLKPPKVPGGEA